MDDSTPLTKMEQNILTVIADKNSITREELGY
jgi:hypothetical protein